MDELTEYLGLPASIFSSRSLEVKICSLSHVTTPPTIIREFHYDTAFDWRESKELEYPCPILPLLSLSHSKHTAQILPGLHFFQQQVTSAFLPPTLFTFIYSFRPHLILGHFLRLHPVVTSICPWQSLVVLAPSFKGMTVLHVCTLYPLSRSFHPLLPSRFLHADRKSVV